MATNANTTPRHVGIFERMANFLLARLPWFRHHYEGWGKGKKILIAFLLYLIVLPIIPIIIALVMFIHDPEGFRKSKAFPILSAIIVAWLAGFGYLASRPATTSSSESSTDAAGGTTAAATQASETTSATTSTRSSTHTSKGGKAGAPGAATRGRYFKNCAAAFAVGVKNIPKVDPSYRPRLDHDGDGVACEK